MGTKAKLFFSPIQDILSLDDSCRLNTPGTITNNWRWKLNRNLDEIDVNLQKYIWFRKTRVIIKIEG